MDTLSNSLHNKSFREKCLLKNNFIASLLTTNNIVNITLKNKQVLKIEKIGIGKLVNDTVVPVTDDEIPVLWIKISMNKKYLNGDGWYGFVNIPIQVPDGTYSESTNPITGEITLVPNYKEDPLAAFKLVLERIFK